MVYEYHSKLHEADNKYHIYADCPRGVLSIDGIAVAHAALLGLLESAAFLPATVDAETLFVGAHIFHRHRAEACRHSLGRIDALLQGFSVRGPADVNDGDDAMAVSTPPFPTPRRQPPVRTSSYLMPPRAL